MPSPWLTQMVMGVPNLEEGRMQDSPSAVGSPKPRADPSDRCADLS